MKTQKILIESLAMDLKRVALGLHRHSLPTAKRFKEEVLKREAELESQKIDDYVKRLLDGSRKALQNDNERAAEDALMYSTLFQNYRIKNFK